MILYYPLSPTHDTASQIGSSNRRCRASDNLSTLREMQRIAAQDELGVPIDPQDPASIAHGIRKLAEDRELLARLRLNVERSRAKPSWEPDEQKLRALLGKLAGPAVAEPSISVVRQQA